MHKRFIFNREFLHVVQVLSLKRAHEEEVDSLKAELARQSSVSESNSLRSKLSAMQVRVYTTVEPLSNPGTNGAEESVIVSEVSSFQRLKCMQEWYLGWERCPV